jgi:hypothetical protein
MKRITACRGAVAAGVLIGLAVLTACGPTTTGAQAPVPTTVVTTQPTRLTTTTNVPPSTTPAKIYAATCGITKPPAPVEMVVSCDSSLDLRQAKWSTWNEVHADGTGQLGVNDCEPDCAGGKLTFYRVSIHFDTPEQTKCGTIWKNAEFTFDGKPPQGPKLPRFYNGKQTFGFTTLPTTLIGC